MQLTQNALFEKVPKNWAEAEALPPSFGQSPNKSISFTQETVPYTGGLVPNSLSK